MSLLQDFNHSCRAGNFARAGELFDSAAPDMQRNLLGGGGSCDAFNDACRRQDHRMTKWLLELADARNLGGALLAVTPTLAKYHPFHFACKNGQLELAKSLLEKAIAYSSPLDGYFTHHRITGYNSSWISPFGHIRVKRFIGS